MAAHIHTKSGKGMQRNREGIRERFKEVKNSQQKDQQTLTHLEKLQQYFFMINQIKGVIFLMIFCVVFNVLFKFSFQVKLLINYDQTLIYSYYTRNST